MGSAKTLLIIISCALGFAILVTIYMVYETIVISKTKLDQIAFDIQGAMAHVSNATDNIAEDVKNK